MKTKYIFLYAIMLLCLSGCTTSFYSDWSCTTYDPLQYTFDIDSVLVASYGKEEVDKDIKSGTPSLYLYNNMVDSIPYFNIRLEQDYSWIPILLIFYGIDFQRPNTPYRPKVRIENNKIYQSLDSINYAIYDSLESKRYEGSWIYNWKFAVSPSYPAYPSSSDPYNIDMKLCEKDVIYGDFDLFFTDINNNFIVQRIKRIKFNYEKNRQTMIIINS
jgi:hypothetical protein